MFTMDHWLSSTEMIILFSAERGYGLMKAKLIEALFFRDLIHIINDEYFFFLLRLWDKPF